jgi:hypothetical protein
MSTATPVPRFVALDLAHDIHCCRSRRGSQSPA